MTKYIHPDSGVEYSIIERKSKNKHPYVVVAEDKNHVCGMEMGRFETRELAIEALKTYEDKLVKVV